VLGAYNPTLVAAYPGRREALVTYFPAITGYFTPVHPQKGSPVNRRFGAEGTLIYL